MYNKTCTESDDWVSRTFHYFSLLRLNNHPTNNQQIYNFHFKIPNNLFTAIMFVRTETHSHGKRVQSHGQTRLLQNVLRGFFQQTNCRQNWYRTSQFVHQLTNPCLYSNIHQTQQATCQRFFGPKIAPSSCHYTRTEKTESLCTIRMDISPFSSKDTLQMYVYKTRKMYLCIKPKLDVLYSYIYSASLTFWHPNFTFKF